MTKAGVVHAIYCCCAALVAAEPALVQVVPVLAGVGPVLLALCSAVMTGLHYMDPADASAAPAKQ